MQMTNAEPFLVFGAPAIGEEEIAEVVACMRSGWLGTGPKVARFEADFAAYRGVGPQHVAAVNSCTAALHVSMLAADLEPGDEVITTPLTFCATVNAIIHAGATPVLADVDPVHAEHRSRCRRGGDHAAHASHRAGAFCGSAVRDGRIVAIAENHGLKIIEDCAHAIETEYHGHPRGASAISAASASTSPRTW